MKAFREVKNGEHFYHNNFRPEQPLGDRKVLNITIVLLSSKHFCSDKVHLFDGLIGVQVYCQSYKTIYWNKSKTLIWSNHSHSHRQ